jgi:8-oxo-dGTP pyrophosphatase MutT (NUDIX family)
VIEASWQAHVTVAALCEQEGRFLLVEELIDGQLLLNQPAGHLDPGESLVEAVVREAREESAWVVEPLALVGLYLWREPARTKSFLRAAFACRCLRHFPDQDLDIGVQRAVWMSHAEVKANQGRLRSPLVLRCIEDFQRGCSYPLDVLQYLSD